MNRERRPAEVIDLPVRAAGEKDAVAMPMGEVSEDAVVMSSFSSRRFQQRLGEAFKSEMSRKLGRSDAEKFGKPEFDSKAYSAGLVGLQVTVGMEVATEMFGSLDNARNYLNTVPWHRSQSRANHPSNSGGKHES